MKDEMLIGPITLEAKVYFTNADGSVIGNANVGLATGKVPTRDDILRAIGQTLEAIPEGCELLDGGRFFNDVLVKEKTGRRGNFAVPANWRYDVEKLTLLASAAYVPDEPTEAADADDDDMEDGDDD